MKILLKFLFHLPVLNKVFKKIHVLTVETQKLKWKKHSSCFDNHSATNLL